MSRRWKVRLRRTARNAATVGLFVALIVPVVGYSMCEAIAIGIVDAVRSTLFLARIGRAP